MASRDQNRATDTERAGGVYGGICGFVIVWIVGSLSGVPFRVSFWRGIAGGIVIYLLTSTLLKILLRVPRGSHAPARAEEPEDD